MFYNNVSDIDMYGVCNHKTLDYKYVRICEQKALSPDVTIATDSSFCVFQCTFWTKHCKNK